MEMGGWMASVKEAGGHIPSRNSGGTISRLNGHCCKIRITAVLKKGKQAKRWGKVVFSFGRKEGRVFFSCGKGGIWL